MAVLNPEDITDFLAQVKAGEEYKNPDCRRIIDEEATELMALVNVGALNNEPGLQAIGFILDSIAAAIRKAQGTPESHAELFEKIAQSYDEMVETLKIGGFKVAPPTKEEVMLHFNGLGQEKLREIAKFMKPTVIITPPGDFPLKVKAIDDHFKREKQRDTVCDPLPDDSLWIDTNERMEVSIVDGFMDLPQPSFITDDLTIGQKMYRYHEEFKKHDLDVMNCHEYAMLMMRSLRYDPTPVDHHTVTFFADSGDLMNDSLVGGGEWDSLSRQVFFLKGAVGGGSIKLRCRPSVKVMEVEHETAAIPPIGASLAKIDVSKLSPQQKESLLEIFLSILKQRFKANMSRHAKMEWNNVEVRLKANPKKMWSLFEMEKTEGEPDVVEYDQITGEYIFYDCSAESPAGRRDCVYDKAAEDSKKKYKPDEQYNGNAVDMAKTMGITIMNKAEYKKLQKLGKFDVNTESWLKTPDHDRINGLVLGGISGSDGGGFFGYSDPEGHLGKKGFRGVLRV